MVRKVKKKNFIVKVSTLIILLLLAVFLMPAVGMDNAPQVITIEIEGMITAGTAAYVQRAVEFAEAENADAVLVLLNTPGGLVDATLDIVTAISSSRVPVITFVNPQGATAASAGAFILLGGHVAAMTPGTTVGAAMPVTITFDEETRAAEDKTILFLAGHIRSIAESKGRPGDVAERFVTENLTLSSQEALDKNIIEYISNSPDILLEELHGKVVSIEDREVVLKTSGAELIDLEFSITERITHILSNPQVTFVLFLIGLYGLILGFSNPGTFVPEVVGAISMLLALYGFGMFETNLFAIFLILLGVALLVAEAVTPTYGVLGAGGLICLILGIIYLPVEPMVTDRWLTQFRMMAVGIGAVGSVFLIILLTGLFRLRKLPVIMGHKEFSGKTALASEDIDPEGYIKVQGELWRAKSKDGNTIVKDSEVRIVERKEMIVIVEPVIKE